MTDMTDMMTAVEDHPEHLLDLAGDDGMSDDQRQELYRHIALCLPCATQLRMSSRSLATGRTRPSDVHLDRVAVNVVLQRAKSSSGRWRPAFAKKWVSVGAGTLLLSSAALAATFLSATYVVGVKERAPTASPSFAPAVVTTGRRSHFKLPPRDLSADVSEVDLAAAPTVASRDTSTAAEPGRLDRFTDRFTDRFSGRSSDRPSAADLFARGRSLRLGGNPTGALTVYRRLQRSYPDSPESHLSYLVAGRMWLDRARPDLAAPQFARYLEAGGSASEEALVGRAIALGRMGRTRDEAADWRRLLSEHPRSVYANRARARLNDEGAGLTGTAGSLASPR